MKDTYTKTKLFNPFPGLRPFSIDESHLFFGREGQSDEVLKLLSNNRFVAVVGTSGSGKSSLMYCGVVPILYGGFVTEAGANWRIVPTRPSNGPISNLAEALVKSDNPEVKGDDLLLKSSVMSSILRSSSHGLIDAVKNLRTDENENILILVDQFEELFRFKRRGEDSTNINETIAFVKLLLEAISQTDVPIYMVLTMRSDFIGECAQFPELTEMINDSYYLIPQMTREDFREAIVGPVAVGGGTISDHLVQQLLNDIGDNPDQLPILQHSLMRTWDYWTKNAELEEPMSIDHYEAIGTMERALSDHANEAFDELSEREKDICQSLFKSITEKGSDNRGIRHPSPLGEVAEIAKAEISEIARVVDVFRKQGRSFLTPSTQVVEKLDGNTIIDISHESLMRIWNKLITWVEDEGNAVQMYLRLCEASNLYEKGKTGLWTPPDLQLALNWREKQKPTLAWGQRHNPAYERAMVYLDTSEKAFIAEEENKIKLQKRALRRSRIFAIVLGSATIISLLFLVNSFVQQAEAEKQRELAEKQSEIAQEQSRLAQEEKKKAEESAKEAEEQKKLAEQQSVIAQQKAEEARLAAIRAEKSAKEAQRQSLIADQKSKEAQEQSVIAKQNAEEALEQKALAEDASKEAYKLRLLSISKSMAVKSVQIHKDTNQKALVAYQAYKFNQEYKGEQHDPDIYDGLYYTLKTLNEPEYNNLEGHTDAIRSIKYSPKGNTLYTTGSDGLIYKWNMEDGEKKGRLISQGTKVNRSMAVSEDNKLLATGTNKATIELMDLEDIDKAPIILEGHEDDVWDIQFTPGSKKLVSCAADGTIFLWDLSTKQYTVIAKSQSEIKSIALSPDGNTVVGGLDNGKIVAWDLSNNNTSKVLMEEKDNIIHVVEFNQAGNILAYGDKLGNVKLYDITKNEVIQTLEGQNARINDIKFSPDDSQIASASFDGSVQLWNTKNFNLQPIVLNDHDSWVQTIAFSPDGLKLIAGCRDNLIRIWPTNTDLMATQICPKISRNMSQEEWNRFVASDIEYENSCEDLKKPEETK